MNQRRIVPTILLVIAICLGCGFWLTVKGCKSFNQFVRNGDKTPVSEKNATDPSLSSTNTFEMNRYSALALDKFYRRQLARYKPTESWGMVPQGSQMFEGVPFAMLGIMEVTGLGPARNNSFYPTRISGIAVGNRFSRLHLIHGAAYDSPDGTPISAVRLNYTDREERSLFIRYGVHVRNWYVERSEKIAELGDPHSRVIWNGNSSASGNGTPTRLFMTTLENPFPDKPVRSIDLLSLFGRANSVFLAMTIEATEPSSPARPADETGIADDSELRREMLLRTLDEANGQALSNILVTVQVAEGARTYGFGWYRSDKHGQILLDYPPGKFAELQLRVGETNAQPVILRVPAENGLFPQEFPIRSKPGSIQPASPPALELERR